MDSSDEEDVHQCGRCKEVFHSIDVYFAHKKSKVCKKQKEPVSGNAIETVVTASHPQPASDATNEPSLSQDSASTPVLAQNDDPASDRTAMCNGTELIFSDIRPDSAGGKNAQDEQFSPDLDEKITKVVAPRKSRGRAKKVKIEKIKSNGNAAAGNDDVQEVLKSETATGGGDAENLGKRKRKIKPKQLISLSDEEHIFEDDNDPEFSLKKPKFEPLVPAVVTRKKRGRPAKGKDVVSKPKLELEDGPEPETSPPPPPTPRKRRGRPPKDMSAQQVEEPPATVTVFACPLCSYTSTCRDELDRHLRRQHKMSLHNCEYCKKSFADKFKLQKHIMDGRCQFDMGALPGDERYDAALIEDELGSEDEGDMTLEEEQEMARKRAVPLFKCYECDELYNSYLEVREHVDVRHADDRKCNPAICTLCGKWFGNREKLWRHLTSPVHDDVPDEELAKIKEESMIHLKYSWKAPAARKPNQRLFECDQCNKTFKYREAFNKHIKYLHPEDGKLLSYKFTCSSCNEQFNHRRTYLSHLKVQHGIKEGGPEDFTCPVCVKKFKQKAHKYRHIESLHTPIQIVPDDIVYTLECDRYKEEIASHVEETNFLNESKQSTENVDDLPGDGKEAEKEDEGFSETIERRPEAETQPRIEVQTKMAHEESVEVHLDTDGNEAETSLAETEFEAGSSTVLELQSDSIVNRLKKAKKTAMPPVMTWLTCPICCEKVTSRSLLLKHMQLHRVWVLRTSKGIATEGVQGVYDALNLRMPNIPRGLTDRETGLKIQDVLVQKTTPEGIAVPLPEEHFSNAMNLGEYFPGDISQIHLDGSFQPVQVQKEPGLNTIDESVVRDLVNEGPPNESPTEELLDTFTVTVDRAVIYKTVQRLVQDIKIKQLLGGGRDEEQEVVTDQDKSDVTFVCPFCVQVHKTLNDCYEHVVNCHSMVAAFQCIQKGCRRVFGSVLDYERHTEVHRQAAFICRVCNVHFEVMLDAVSHKSSAHRSMNQTEVNRCELCNRTFASKDALSKHVAMDTHHHQCDQCGKVMKNENDLRDHELTHKGVRPYLCDQCGAAFANKIHMNRHRRLHFTSPKCLQCDQCTATFAKREHLKRHLQTQHTDEKPFACQYPGCDKAFKRKDKLQDHYRMHSSETPYQCPLCGKAYRYREALKYHEKTHRKESKHFCTMCDAGFPRPAALRSHLKESHQIHLKNQHSYPCPQCGNVFSRPERLRRHMEFRHSVTAEWKFKCPVCGRGCAGKKSFKTHMLRKHSLDGPIEQLLNIDITPFVTMEKQRKKQRTEPKPVKMENIAMVEDIQQQHEQQLPVLQEVQVQQQQQQMQEQEQQQQIITVQQPLPQQAQPEQQHIQLRMDDTLQQQSVTAILQPQQTHQSFTLQNPQDPGSSTIYLIPSGLGDKDQLVQNMVGIKDQLVQNMVGFPQLVMTPSGTIQTQSLQNTQIATAQHQTQPVAIHNQIQNVTLTGATAGITGQVAHGPVHTVLMTAPQAIQRTEVTAAQVNLQQVATSAPGVQQHNTFSTIAPYSGFVNNYEQF